MLTTKPLLKRGSVPLRPSLIPRQGSRDIQPIYLPPDQASQESDPAILAPEAIATPHDPPKRRRGGQPGNQNARKFKKGDAGTPAPDANLTYIDLDRRHRRQHQAAFTSCIHELTDMSRRLSPHFDTTLHTGQHKASRHVFKFLISCANNINRLSGELIRLTWQDRTLSSCANQAHSQLRRYENPDLFVFKPLLQKVDTLSTYAGQPHCPVSFLNDRQWKCLESLIRDQVAENRAAALARRDPEKKQRTSRLVPWPARFLLDGILWKLATARPWPKLPKPYPARRCQALYQSLKRSGRLGYIFTILHDDLVEFGEKLLPGMALNGEYMLWGSKVLYIPHGKPDWQGLTSLLLLQCTRRLLLRDQRKRRHTFIALLESDGPRMPPQPSYLGLLSKLVKRHPLIPAGTVRTPPPFYHPALRYYPPFAGYYRHQAPPARIIFIDDSPAAQVAPLFPAFDSDSRWQRLQLGRIRRSARMKCGR